ncbi:MAG: c-type cytochrome [Planctomycetaceae bacterium]
MPANDTYSWNQKTLNVVFALSSVAMLLAVILMMKKDQADEWRPIQRKNFQLEARLREVELQGIETKAFESQKAELQKEIDKAARAVEAAKAEPQNAELFAKLDSEQREVDRLGDELKSLNGIRDESRAKYDLAVRDSLPADIIAERMADFERRQQLCDEKQVMLDAAAARLAETTLKTKAVTKEYDELVVAMEKLTKEESRVKASLEKIKPSSLISSMKRSLMEMPIIDGFNSHLKVVQDWMPKLRQTLGMAKIARFDRCRTCHQNIDKTLAGGIPAFPEGHPSTDDVADWVSENKFPQPYATHSNTELYCTASSPHPVEKFGCTICHDGQGSGTSFGNAEHTPNNPQIADEWHEAYGYHANHFWEYPMQPSRFAESTCIKCHHGMTELGVNPEFGASAPKAFKGWQLIQKYGCYGCHEIHGQDAGVAIGPDLRVEPQTPEELARVEADPTQVAGKLRKVGPSLRHIDSKTTSAFIQYWTEVPTRFRPSTKMPQFFDNFQHLSEADAAHTRELEAVELAGIATVLLKNSQPMELLKPAAGYQADPERGKKLFSERGCLACHQHGAVPGTTADFGPNISDIHLKLKRNADNPGFSDWLYTWIRDPQRYHSRSKMPNLFLDVYTDVDGATQIDPAADITAFLLSQGPPSEFPVREVDTARLDELVSLFLRKSRFSKEKAEEIIRTGQFDMKKSDVIGDESALATDDGSAVADPAEWHNRKLEFVGRKTIGRYGCYACHDMPGFEAARPIGVALQDWGRKDTSKLGFEHVEEFLHHHGEPPDSKYSSTFERVEAAVSALAAGEDKNGDLSPAEVESEMSAAFFFESLQHHGRAGFIWQKLRGPRTYDFEKTETKGYDERLRMPKFPLKEDEIEAIATFVLGLIAEPPAPEYVYTPDERTKNRLEGEFLLAKYNCTGCHVVELPQVTYATNLDDVTATEMTPGDHEKGLEMLLKLRPPGQALTGETKSFVVDEENVRLPLLKLHGFIASKPDPEEEDPEFREYGFDVWSTADVGTGDETKRLLPGHRVSFTEKMLVNYQSGRGGDFAEWLVEDLMQTKTGGNRSLAWQASPPPLYQEGFKVQTPWLYQFLLEPSQIRYTTVLRMPKFNLSEKEARTLANYFAAVDGAEFPYQERGPAAAEYLASTEAELAHAGLLKDGDNYLNESWKTLNGPLCVKCHSVGGRKFKVSDPAKDIQGPNLNVVQNRLRADWVKLWLYKPTWITPYTSMPLNFPKNNTTQFPDLFSGDPDAQVTASRDALLNYTRLMEDIGPTVYAPPGTAPADGAAPAATPEETETPADAAAAADQIKNEKDPATQASVSRIEESAIIVVEGAKK